MMEVSLITTNDTPDGQQWPPADSSALWVEVRRANGCTLWRAIACQVRSLPRASAILYWQLQRGGLPMATRSERYPRRFVSTDDLKGRPVIVEIEEERLEELTDTNGKTASKPVLSFVGKEKKLVLNATNWDVIVEITGCEDSRDWPGHKVELFPTTTLMAGRRVDCIRIRRPSVSGPEVAAPPPAPPPPADDMSDESPF
jgi:hypothetical protein